jgi:hypothetical protein
MKPFIETTCPDNGRSRMFTNGKYTAIRTPLQDTHGSPMMMLSVRRDDRRAIMDWRDLQWVKNQLLGEETEAVQLFPAESRLVDSANQYFLFAYNLQPSFVFPFGFTERLVTQDISIRMAGHSNSEQRPFAPHVRPVDLEDNEVRFRQYLREAGGVERSDEDAKG